MPKLVPCKGSPIHKFVVVCIIQFNYIDLERSNNGLVNNFCPYHHSAVSSCPLLAKCTSELDKIYTFGHPSNPSNVS